MSTIPTLTEHLAAHQWRTAFFTCACRDRSIDIVSHPAHVAATFREARTVTTREQVARLPETSLIRDSEGLLWEMFDVDPGDVVFPALVTWMPADEEVQS